MPRKPLAILATALALSMAPGAAQAGFYTGDELYGICTVDRSDKEYVEKTYECIAYITGAVDAFNTTREVNGLKSCLPPEVAISDLRAKTVTYLGNNPVDRAKSASSQVFAATRKAWPCPAAKPAAKKGGAKAKTRKRK